MARYMNGVVAILTGGRTTLEICVPFIANNNVTNISITKLTLRLRLPTSGYFISDGYDATSFLTEAGIKRNQGLLIITCKSETAWQSFTNNTPLIGIVEIAYTTS